MNTLDLALIGNCTVGALVDARAKIVWGCFPRFDGDPVFCSLLRDTDDYGFPRSNWRIASAPSSTTWRTRRSW